MNSGINYRGYTGSIEFSEEDAVFHGKVVGIKSTISFEGDCVQILTEDFHNAIDEYIEHCGTAILNLTACFSSP
jgi:predicted HicB family RNase H-like nuclease